MEPHGILVGIAGGAAARGALSREFGLIVPSDLGIQSVGRVYESRDSGATKADKLAAKLETLGPGLWLHIDHASTDDEEMRAFGHKGYEWVAADRSANSRRLDQPEGARGDHPSRHQADQLSRTGGVTLAVSAFCSAALLPLKQGLVESISIGDREKTR